MKLQPKRKIQADLADQKKAQIDEGMALASKIDTLRETLVKEQGKLERFRVESVATVTADINKYLAQKHDLINENRELAEERKLLLLPLDAKWEEVRQHQKICTEWKIDLEGYEAHLEERQQEVQNDEREIELQKGRLDDLKHATAENYALSEETLTHAREEARSLRTRAQEILASSQMRERLVIEKEADLIRREAYIAGEQKKILEQQIDLAKREKLLRDNYQTLERAQLETYGRR